MTFFSWVFDFLLIIYGKYLLFGVYFSVYQRNTIYKYRLQRKPTIDTSRYTFSLASDIAVEKSYFFSCSVKIPCQQLLIFLYEQIFESN